MDPQSSALPTELPRLRTQSKHSIIRQATRRIKSSATSTRCVNSSIFLNVRQSTDRKHQLIPPLGRRIDFCRTSEYVLHEEVINPGLQERCRVMDLRHTRS